MSADILANIVESLNVCQTLLRNHFSQSNTAEQLSQSHYPVLNHYHDLDHSSKKSFFPRKSKYEKNGQRSVSVNQSQGNFKPRSNPEATKARTFARSDRPLGNKAKQQPKNMLPEEEYRFAKIVITILKCKHHLRNWEGKNLPNRVLEHVEILSSFTRPYSPNESLNLSLKDISFRWGNDVKRLLIQHYEELLSVSMAELRIAAKNLPKKDAAFQLAEYWFKHSFRKSNPKPMICALKNEIQELQHVETMSHEPEAYNSLYVRPVVCESDVIIESRLPQSVASIGTATSRACEDAESIITAESRARENVASIVTVRPRARDNLKSIPPAGSGAHENVESMASATSRTLENAGSIITTDSRARENIESSVTAGSRARDNVESILITESGVHENVESIITAGSRARKNVELIGSAGTKMPPRSQHTPAQKIPKKDCTFPSTGLTKLIVSDESLQLLALPSDVGHLIFNDCSISELNSIINRSKINDTDKVKQVVVHMGYHGIKHVNSKASVKTIVNKLKKTFPQAGIFITRLISKVSNVHINKFNQYCKDNLKEHFLDVSLNEDVFESDSDKSELLLVKWSEKIASLNC